FNRGLLRICSRQTVIERQSIGADKSHISAQQSHGAQRSITDDSLRYGANRTSEQLHILHPIIGQRQRAGQATRDNGQLVCCRGVANEVIYGAGGSTSI